MTPRSILIGTFRLSIVAAILAAVYGFYEQLEAWGKARDANYKMLVALECGTHLSESTLKLALNQYGNIDLSKVGCTDRQFITSFDEIERTRTGEMKRELTGRDFDFGYGISYALSYALVALVLINLAGFALVVARAVLRWIAAGFSTS